MKTKPSTQRGTFVSNLCVPEVGTLLIILFRAGNRWSEFYMK